MWRAQQHSDQENQRWAWLRAIEWIQWPLFISQPVVPVLLYFFEWRCVVLLLILVTFVWRMIVVPARVSVAIADLGPFLVLLKFLVCPIMAFLI